LEGKEGKGKGKGEGSVREGQCETKELEGRAKRRARRGRGICLTYLEAFRIFEEQHPMLYERPSGCSPLCKRLLASPKKGKLAFPIFFLNSKKNSPKIRNSEFLADSLFF
jgi:hypothetical protein